MSQNTRQITSASLLWRGSWLSTQNNMVIFCGELLKKIVASHFRILPCKLETSKITISDYNIFMFWFWMLLFVLGFRNSIRSYLQNQTKRSLIVGGEEKSMRNSPVSTKMKGEGVPGAWAGVFCSPRRDMVEHIPTLQLERLSHTGAGGHAPKELWPLQSPCWSRFVLEDSSSWRGPKLDQGKSMWRKECQGGAAIHWLQPPSSLSPLYHSGDRR